MTRLLTLFCILITLATGYLKLNSITPASSASDEAQRARPTYSPNPGLIGGPYELLFSNLAESIDTGTMRNGMRSCPIGQFVVGVDFDGNRLLCSNQPVTNSSAPYTANFEMTDTTTMRLGLKACPENFGMTGLSVVNNKVSCAHVGKMKVELSTNTRRSQTDACPSGRVMVGFDDDSNKVLCGKRIDTCFGAIGSRCGVTSEPFVTPFALCVADHCLVNAGSWEHDECCWQFPNGKLCRTPDGSHDGNCTVSLSKAISRLSKGYNWKVAINFSLEEENGVVNRNLFCAPPGTIVHRSDPNRCCSSSLRTLADPLTDPIRAAADAAQAAVQQISPLELASGNPRVCR